MSARKFYAIPEEDIGREHVRGGVKRLRSSLAHTPTTRDAAEGRSDDLLIEIKSDIAAIQEKTDTIMTLSKDLKIPLGLQRLLHEAFACQICAAIPMQPPILLAKCCKSIIGCEECVNRWYSGPDALTKSCPRCRSERGYNETMRVLGLDDLLTGLKRLNDTDM